MDDIYKEELMDIYRNPSKKGHLDKPTATALEKNPFCGDEVTLELEIKDGIIKDARFSGSACAVSVISSEILIENILDKSVEEVKKLTKEDLLDMIDLNLTTSRIACATLILIALKGAVKKYDQKNN